MNARKMESPFASPEFVLVTIMLIVLTILVSAVLFAPGPEAATAADLFDYRKSILAIILAAFGAWVGAGAAYYFGRENLREATRNMLAMREPSPEERLRRIQILEAQPRMIDWRVRTSDLVETVVNALKSEPQRWFIPVVKDEDETLKTVLGEEAIWRFISDNAKDVGYDELMKNKMSDVLVFLDKAENEKLKERSEGSFVYASLEDSAGEISDLMSKKNANLAIITNESGKPVYFITTGDIRRLLLRPET